MGSGGRQSGQFRTDDEDSSNADSASCGTFCSDAQKAVSAGADTVVGQKHSESSGAVASQPLPQMPVKPKLQSPQSLHASHDEPRSGGGKAVQPLPQASVVPHAQPQPLQTWQSWAPGSGGALASQTPDAQVSIVADAHSPQSLHTWHDCVPHGWQPLALAT
ncbi:MAG: hypothetical protein ABUR63_05570 [Verrucomicrobiota bacterium]